MADEVRKRQRLGPQERREQLMAATVEVLAVHGYRGVTADAIARRAGVSKGLLWHYFADLDELFEMTARRTLKTLMMAAGHGIDLEAPAPQVIRQAVHAAVTLRRTHARERRALSEIIQNLRTPDGQPHLGIRDLDDLYGAQEAIFRRGQHEGHFRTTLDPRLLAVTYQGAVDSMLGYLDAVPDADPERHADTVADVLLDGIANRH
ncbi:MAG TPA: TetR family transcriptional regulator [Pedococcus sp.]|jgi:AcrR family transcriptional regulator|nr:TetR family transcriptional regulator [Pedococcus sp.]